MFNQDTADTTKKELDLFAAPRGSEPITMSSREIAELTGSTHDNVLKTVRGLIERGVVSKNETPYVHSQNGQAYVEFQLSYRDTMVVVSGYSVELRARIIDRWQALEAVAAAPSATDLMQVLNNPAAMRGLLLTYSEKVLTLQAENAAMLPKVAAHDRIAESFGSTCRRIAAKNLGIPPMTLNRWMKTNGWTYRHLGDKHDLAYQSKIAAGYLEHKVETGDKADGTAWTGTSVRVTPKGLLALAKAFPPAVSEV